MSRFATLKNITLGAMLAGGIAIGGAGLVLAQDDEATASHPVHIHAGDCVNLDPNPAVPLNNIEPRGAGEEEEGEDAPAPQGILTAANVLYSLTDDSEFSFDDEMLAESHAINIHESDDNIQNYIACGDIGGVVFEDELVIALQPLNDSGYSGIAILTKDDDGGNVDVKIYLAEPPADGVEATPVS